MKLNLEDCKVLVTGGSDGIGRAMALAFAGEGARVAVCARSQAGLDKLKNEMSGQGHIFKTADLTKVSDVESLHATILEQWGGLDVLVNNVGAIQKMGTFLDLTDEDWREVFDINLLSAVRVLRLFIPELRKSSAPSIINISSIAAVRPEEVFPHYSAMKAGLSNLTASLSQTLAGDGIRVNTISPGPVWSRSWENEALAVAQETGKKLETVREEFRAGSAERIPLKRMGEPEDLSGLVLLLASQSSAWITGSNFTVDGGIVRNL
ncbi:MAG: 3-oxoacyl-ACP reductase [Nitrospinae bacterium CG11_big_fil_rev_8_21_14_0_20_45_15]|nr:MAG: 3-oxoacyl-ACP reductase [Nitrospinae bacterium CG11_big_fil_rev_8_21_14_0_20_45_15]